MLSALVFLRNNKYHGRLVQIQTGEGKTNIVSLLAAIKVLQGKKVDVITSNEVLADDGVRSTKDFYNVLGITLATNNPDDSYKKGARGCYQADVVYGNIGNFQFDYLRDFSEGLGTRGAREFSVVILDEVDSMLLDNGGHIAKLATPFPGMDILKYIYIKIWEELHIAEEGIVDDYRRDLENKSEELSKNSTLSKEELYSIMQEYTANILERSMSRIAEKIKLAHPENIDLVPPHLKDYAKSMLDRWIHNALYAKHLCTEDREYVIRKVEGEDFIIPIDYENTGVTMRNTIWSDGLHQFVQLKHNLQITTETLISSFISNFGYIKFYKQIYGMTGTLGSVAEQRLLFSVYEVDFAKVPTFKPKKFEELDGIVVHDDDWLNLISIEAIAKTLQGRPVLVICKTIRDLIDIEQNIRRLQESEDIKNINIRSYIDEDHSGVVKAKLNESEIVLATNIGGRGTDFKTTKTARKNGGLHVIISFLPANKRVEDQAFGRTSRQGNPGTGQLIIKEYEMLSLGIIISNETSFDSIKMERDGAEARRLDDILNIEVDKIKFQDGMFEKFADLYRKFSKQFTSLNRKFLSMDLKEFWAFWLHKANYNKENITGLVIETEFKKFTKDTYKILGLEKDGEYGGGKISHNPYYSILLAEFLLEKNDIEDAKQELEHAIRLSAANSNLLYSAYLKLFEVEIKLGEQMWIRFKKALGKMAIYGYFWEPKSFSEYKHKAKKYLVKANNSLSIEINYINENFLGIESISSRFSNILNSTKKMEDNLLVSHINSRLYVLLIFRNHINSLWEEIEKSGSNGIIVGSRIPNYLKTMGNGSNEVGKKARKSINDAELGDFSMAGLDTIYRMANVNDPSTVVILAAQGQIAGGTALLGVGAYFPPSAPFSVPAGITVIVEGITDLFMEILDVKGQSIFNAVEYLKIKAISYGTAIATFGIEQIFKIKKFVNIVINSAKKLKSVLEKCPALSFVFKYIMKYIDDLSIYLEKYVARSAFKTAQLLSLTKGQLFKYAAINVGERSFKRVVSAHIYQKVVLETTKHATSAIRPMIQKTVIEVLNARNMKQRLESLDPNKVHNLTVDIIQGTFGKIATQVLEEIGLGILQWSIGNVDAKNPYLNILWKISGSAVDATSKLVKFKYYAENFCDKFEEQSSRIASSSSKTLKNVEESFNFITEKLTDKMFKISTVLVGKIIHRHIVEPMTFEIGRHGFSQIKKITKLGSGVKQELSKVKTSYDEFENSSGIKVRILFRSKEDLSFATRPFSWSPPSSSSSVINQFLLVRAKTF
jgi:hypothetical protein